MTSRGNTKSLHRRHQSIGSGSVQTVSAIRSQPSPTSEPPMRRLALLLLPLSFAACEGPAGPTGPAGPQGEPGPGTRTVLTATVSASGSASVTLPAAAGTLADPPGLTCYVTQPGSTVALLVGLDLDGPTCGLLSSGTTLVASIIDAPPGWIARFTVVY
jgi:hypothetical protein